MVTKTLIAVAIGAAIGLSPLRDSALANFLIAITGGVKMLGLIISGAAYI